MSAIESRLEYLRSQIRAENISYSEIAELQSLADHIPDGDVELQEWAGISERVVERTLTVTVTEHIWTTYRVPVSPDFDAADILALEDLIVNANDDELEVVEMAVEHREIDVEGDSK